MLDEHLKSLQIDQSNISKIIAFTTNKKEDDIMADMHNRTTISPEEAKSYGLVTEIKNTLMPANAEFYSIGEFDGQSSPLPQFMMPPIQLPIGPDGIKTMTPRNENYTSLFARGFSFTNSL